MAIALLVAACSSPAPSVTSLAVDLSNELYVNGTYQAGVTVQAQPGASQAVTWSSSDTAVATVNAGGQVRAVSPGTATITATSVADSTRTDSVTVTVEHPLAGLRVLYFTDDDDPTLYLAALEALRDAEEEYGLQLTAHLENTFLPEWLDEGYDLVFHYRRNNGNDLAEREALADYAFSGGSLIFGTFDYSDAPTQALAADLGAPYTGNENWSEVEITDPELRLGLSNPTLTLTNYPGWGTFNTSHSLKPYAEAWATYPEDRYAGLVASEYGRLVVLGFFEDSLDPVDGKQFFSNLFTKVARMTLEGPPY